MDKEKQNQIIDEIVSKCTNKEIADELMVRLERKWGKPKIHTFDSLEICHVIGNSKSRCVCLG